MWSLPERHLNNQQEENRRSRYCLVRLPFIDHWSLWSMLHPFLHGQLQGYRTDLHEVLHSQANSFSQLLLIHSSFQKYHFLFVSVTQLILSAFCYIALMHQQVQHGKLLPQINKKSISLHSVFDLIKKKKHQLSRIIKSNGQDASLPKIRRENDGKQPSISFRNDKSVQRDQIHREQKDFFNTPIKQYRTILQSSSQSQEKFQRVKEISSLDLQSNQKQYTSMKKNKNQPDFGDKRIKTQANKIARKATHITQTQTHRQEHQQAQIDYNRIQQAKQQFISSIPSIPKSIKLRNQTNLLQSVESLEVFNPFANRNHRMVNICLLKMGQIVAYNSTVLYKIGEQLNYFYVILMGKVKLINGSLRKVCQTGQTILEQILFSDKDKKIALQRAKVIGSAILLQMKIDCLNKLKQELIRYGYKLAFNEMESIIKRNYIVKNWLRNKIKLQENQ